MSEYVLDHDHEGERERLALMSRLLDPMHRRHIESMGIGAGARALEVGCGNGSISAWLANRVAQVVAFDLDLSLVEVRAPNLELRQGDIVTGPVESSGFDLVTARAVLHHVSDPQAAIRNLVASARAGGAIVLIEPDFLPVTIAAPPEVRDFWERWLAWSQGQRIDYFIGRRLPEILSELGLEGIESSAETALYNGGSAWARYWELTVLELREHLITSGELDETSIERFLAYCADPRWWTQTIAFTAVQGRSRSTQSIPTIGGSDA